MVNTLKLRGIDACLPEIQTFLREIEQSFLQVLNNCVPARERSYPVEGIGVCLQNSSSPDLALVTPASKIDWKPIPWHSCKSSSQD